LRATHGAAKLSYDASIAEKVQAEVDRQYELAHNGDTPGGLFKADRDDTAKSFVTSDCQQLIYEAFPVRPKGWDAIEENWSNVYAVDKWYAAKQYYDFPQGKAKKDDSLTTAVAAARKADVEAFTAMLWKKTTKVGFGAKGKWVVAHFCNARKTTDPKDTFAYA